MYSRVQFCLLIIFFAFTKELKKYGSYARILICLHDLDLLIERPRERSRNYPSIMNDDFD